MDNLFGKDRAQLAEFFTSIDEKSFRSSQLLQWLYQHEATSFDEMLNFSKKLRSHLNDNCQLSIPQIVETHLSQDGVVKWIIQLTDGNHIETVFIPENNRGTLCISSQVGCFLDCRFCATALQGFNRNLTSAEIIGQVRQAVCALKEITETEQWRELRWQGESLWHRVSNVVFMGMGEPLLNMQQVVPAINLLLDDFSYGFSKHRVTISTAGVAPMISELALRAEASLAVSLHSAIEETRSDIVPLNKKYPINELMTACWKYVRAFTQKRHILFEYVMLRGVNDDHQHARALVKLLRDFPGKVNLIPFNPYPGLPFECSDMDTIERFRHELKQAKINTTIRKTRGVDIAAACGQLSGKVHNRKTKNQVVGQESDSSGRTSRVSLIAPPVALSASRSADFGTSISSAPVSSISSTS